MATATPEVEQSKNVQLIPLSEIAPSKTNRTVTDAMVADMAASIKKDGVLQPIMLRPHANGKTSFELVCGEVRWRGAQQAGLARIPALVRSVTDAEAQAIQIIENLQRTDPGPMDEAESYARLKTLLGPKTTVEQIAVQVGKKPSYVAQRMKLLALHQDAVKALRENRITAAHALQIAPLDTKQQGITIKWLLEGYETDADTARGYIDISGIHSVEALRTFIENSFLLVLGNAPFDLTDAKLVPKMGACTSCSYNTANAGLFPDIVDAHCMKPDCYFDKQQQTIDIMIAKAAKEREMPYTKIYRLGVGDGYHNAGPAKTKVDGYLATNSWERRSGNPVLVAAGKECKSTKPAVLVFKSRDLPKEIKAELGAVVSICADKDCEKHHAKDSEGSGYRTPKAALKGLALVEHKQTTLSQSRPQRVRWVIYKTFVDALFKTDSPESLRPSSFKPQMAIAAKQALEHLYSDSARDAAKALGWVKTPKNKKTGKGYGGYEPWRDRFEAFFKGKPAWMLLMGVMAAEDIRSDYDTPKRYRGFEASQLKILAELYKVDAKKIAKEVLAADQALIAGMKKRAQERQDKVKDEKAKKEKFNKSLQIMGSKDCWYVERKLDKPLGPNSAAPGLKTMPEAGPFKTKKLAEECMKLIQCGMKAKAATKQVRDGGSAVAAKYQKEALAGMCYFCKCTEERACNPPCSWVDNSETICSNPACVAKAVEAGLIKKAKKSA